MKKANVLKFPVSPAVERARAANDPALSGEEPMDVTEHDGGSRAKRVVCMIGRAVRFVVFMVLYWLRAPIVGICNLISIPMMIAAVFVWYAFPEKGLLLWVFGVTSFVAFVLSWTYDYLLMLLSPVPMVDTL